MYSLLGPDPEFSFASGQATKAPRAFWNSLYHTESRAWSSMVLRVGVSRCHHGPTALPLYYSTRTAGILQLGNYIFFGAPQCSGSDAPDCPHFLKHGLLCVKMSKESAGFRRPGAGDRSSAKSWNGLGKFGRGTLRMRGLSRGIQSAARTIHSPALPRGG